MAAYLPTRYSFHSTDSERGNMPQDFREQSEAGVYHVAQRGISQTNIFCGDEDKETFLSRLSRY